MPPVTVPFSTFETTLDALCALREDDLAERWAAVIGAQVERASITLDASDREVEVAMEILQKAAATEDPSDFNHGAEDYLTAARWWSEQLEHSTGPG